MVYLDDLPIQMPPVAIAAIPRPRRCLARWRTWKPSCSLVHEIDEPKKSWGLDKTGIIFYITLIIYIYIHSMYNIYIVYILYSIYVEVSIVMGYPKRAGFCLYIMEDPKEKLLI